MAITAQEVNQLRKSTGAGMMDCKKALVEAEGDFDKAIDLLRATGQKVSAKRADNETTEGSIFVKTNDTGAIGYLLALSCETDFVAKNDDFQNFGTSLIEAAIAGGAQDVDAVKSVKMSDGRTVADSLVDYIGKIGEKIEISNFSAVTADKVVPYIHSNGKLGVLVGLSGASEGVDEIGRDVAMQIAAMNPIAIDKTGVDQATIDREFEVGKEQALAEGKPEAMIEKIATGKLNKYFKENTLLSQSFVKDNKKSIEQVLKEVNNDLTVSEFKRVAIG